MESAGWVSLPLRCWGGHTQTTDHTPYLMHAVLYEDLDKSTCVQGVRGRQPDQ